MTSLPATVDETVKPRLTGVGQQRELKMGKKHKRSVKINPNIILVNVPKLIEQTLYHHPRRLSLSSYNRNDKNPFSLTTVQPSKYASTEAFCCQLWR